MNKSNLLIAGWLHAISLIAFTEAFSSNGISISSCYTLKNAMISSPSSSSMNMAGGRGWGNDDFLSSLGGSDEERDDEQQKYNEFKSSREAFDQRQQERMNSPSGQKFMQDMRDRQGMMPPSRDENLDSDGGFFADMGFRGGEGGNAVPEGKGRFASMMNQAQSRMQGGPAGVPGRSGLGGFEQKLAIPLDDDDDEDGEGVIGGEGTGEWA